MDGLEWGIRILCLIDADGVPAEYNPQEAGSRRMIDDGLSQKVATIAGAGISIHSLWSVYRRFTDGSLIRILPRYTANDHSVLWLVYPKSSVLTAEVRVFIDFLLNRIGNSPVWEKTGPITMWARYTNTGSTQNRLFQVQRRKLVDNKWVTFIEDKFQLPNGTDCTYYHARKSDAVMIIAIDDTDPGPYTYIVNQHRHPIGRSIWQFPIGGFDSSSQAPEDAARKELQEETGVLAGDIEYLGSFYADPGFTNQKLHVCATRNILKVGEQKLERLEHGLVCRRIQTGEIKPMIESGEMGDAWGLAGHYYMHSFLSFPE